MSTRSNDFLMTQGKRAFRDFHEFLEDQGKWNFHEEQRFSDEPRKVDFLRFPRIGSGEWKQPRPLTNDTYATNEETKKHVCFALNVSSRFYENKLPFSNFRFVAKKKKSF